MTVIHSLVIRNVHTGEVWSCHDAFDPELKCLPTIAAGIKLLEGADVIVGHNVIKFDVPAIKKIYPTFKPKGWVLDTLILARLLWPDIEESDDARRKKFPLQFPTNMRGLYGLEAFGCRLGKWKGDYSKVMKAAGLDPWANWCQQMQDYCEQDVEVTVALFIKALHRWFDTQGGQPFSDECVELEHRVAEIVARQERHGFAFNVPEAEAFYLDLIDRRSTLERTLKETFKPWIKPGETKVSKVNNKKLGRIKGEPYRVDKLIEFNPSSRDHIADRLKVLFNWEPIEFTDGGKPKVDDTILGSLPWPEAKLLTEYLTVQKRIGALSEGPQAWLKKVKNGRIHGSVTTGGACTGRMTHASPNVGQVPGLVNKKTGEKQAFGWECRNLFTSSAGYALLGCDADALELRCLGGYMASYDGGAYIEVILKGDKKLGTDMHTVNAKALGITGPDAREIAKKWFYAFIYGAGDWKLGFILGVYGAAEKTSAAGKKSKASFMRNLPALGKLAAKVREKAKAQGFLRGLDGRKLFVRKAHASLNTLLQSAGAIIMKQALVILDDDLRAAGLSPNGEGGEDYEFCANIHDEWQIDINEKHVAEGKSSLGSIAEDSIRKAGEVLKFKCPLAGNYSIGRTWAETH